MNYLITIAYDGRNYHGWQVQKNADSIQARTENACLRLFGEKITVYGCSRTDTGVHANCFMANFHADKVLSPDTVVNALNFYLPPDIAVRECVYVPEGFHARFCCTSKEYLYKICNTSVRDPFSIGRALHYRPALDADFLNRQAQDFIGRHDFSALRAQGSTVKTTVRTVHYADVTRNGPEVIFRVAADGFLYNMVRIMAGTLLYISEGKIPADSIPMIIRSKDRLTAGKTLPPDGLYLNRVSYEKGVCTLRAE